MSYYINDLTILENLYYCSYKDDTLTMRTLTEVDDLSSFSLDIVEQAAREFVKDENGFPSMAIFFRKGREKWIYKLIFSINKNLIALTNKNKRANF